MPQHSECSHVACKLCDLTGGYSTDMCAELDFPMVHLNKSYAAEVRSSKAALGGHHNSGRFCRFFFAVSTAFEVCMCGLPLRHTKKQICFMQKSGKFGQNCSLCPLFRPVKKRFLFSLTFLIHSFLPGNRKIYCCIL